jgi:hypothetical protein
VGPVNASFIIRAELKNGTVPITGATAGALVAFVNGTGTQNVPMADNGLSPDTVANDGVYAGTFSSTSQAGTYNVVITATGNFLPGQPFSREAYTQLAVSQSTSQILPAVTDFGRDTNSNSRFDQLVIRVPLQITTAGAYRLAGVLRDSLGNEQRVSALANLTTASTGMELLFDGATIFGRAVDGPYTLASLRLAEEINGQIVPVAERGTPYSTAAYSYTQFEGGGLSLTGSNSAQGIDQDANGKFDLLRVTLGINVPTAGFYSWSARLRDRTGHEITLTNGQANLPAGVSSIVLNFNGRAIGENGVDGPYEVTDLLMLGSGGTLSVANVFATPPLPASSFEGFVADTIPPTLRINATPDLLWPPNHRMVEITIDVEVSDNLDPNPLVQLVSVASNEGQNLKGDGNTSVDISVDPATNRISLRAERSGLGNDRIYTITFGARDAAGNTTTATTQVVVPHDRGKK